MPHLDLDALELPPQPQAEPITFRLAGQTFECLPPPIPWGPLSDILGLVAPLLGPNGDVNVTDNRVIIQVAMHIDKIESFILGVLRDDDGEPGARSSSETRFRALRNDKRARVDAGHLTPLISHLITAYTGRPTAAPTPSEPGRSPNGTTSTDAGVSPESTSPPSVVTPAAGSTWPSPPFSMTPSPNA